MREQLYSKNYHRRTNSLLYQSQATIEEKSPTSTETQPHSIWQLFNDPVLTRNSSVEKKEESGSSADETFWFEVVSLPEVTEEAILSKDDLQSQIEKYEKKFGMTSQEFIQKYQDGNISDTFEMMDWIMLLEYQKVLCHHAI